MCCLKEEYGAKSNERKPPTKCEKSKNNSKLLNHCGEEHERDPKKHKYPNGENANYKIKKMMSVVKGKQKTQKPAK